MFSLTKKKKKKKNFQKNQIKHFKKNLIKINFLFIKKKIYL